MSHIQYSYIFCPECNEIKPLEQDKKDGLSYDKKHKGKDMWCAECGYMITLFNRESE